MKNNLTPKEKQKVAKAIDKIEIYRAGEPDKDDWGQKTTYADYNNVVNMIAETRIKINEIIDFLDYLKKEINEK
jgi:hypothetical protein